MKIYNKKTFVEGLFMVLLAALNLVMGIITHDFDVKRLILVGALCFLGGRFLKRSMSRKDSREDQLEAMDERNQLIQMKHKSKAFEITQLLSFLLILVFIVLYTRSRYEGYIGMIVGLGLVYGISLFADLFTFIYYESKN